MGWLKPSKAWKRTISVLTILALLITTMPVSLAVGSDTTRQASPRQAILAEEETLEPTAEPTPTPEVSETAIPDPTPDPSGEPEPTVTPEESVSPEPSLSPSPSPLPYDLPGMPADFVLSEDQMHAKEAMSTKDIVSITEALTPGEDYVDKQVMFWADSKEYAENVAAAYNGELVSYSDHIALVELRSTTVMQALSVAADTTNNMPALDANHIITLDPGEKNAASKADFDFSIEAEAPSKQSWFDRPDDPFLQSPDAYDYQWMHDVVNSYEAWGVTTGSSSIKVAVVDTGVRTTHEDLFGRVSVVDMSDITGESNDDADGHGTHVAGIIAATSDNGVGGAGIAPGVSILSLAALPGGSGDDYNIAIGILRAVNAGAHIINMSFGGYWYNGTMDDVIQVATANKVACIAAMGNDGSNSYCYPAAYSNVIAVAAVNSDLTRANFSNYGSWADVAAPGVDINSSTGDSDSSYDIWDGTSMATPVVSGVAALYLSMTGRISPSSLEKKLESCVTKSSSSSIGSGVVDASKLFSADKTPPKITVKNTFGTPITSFTSPIPQESTLTIESGTGATNAKMIIYTIDGSTPSVKNGEVYNGIVYNGEISLATFPTGKPITFKAVCISGMGVMSSSTAVKFTLSLNSSIDSLIMSGVERITAGGKATYTATVLPTVGVSQKVLWSIVTRTNAVKATISSTGILTTYAKDGGEVTIRATSAVNPAKYVEKVVTIVDQAFIKTMTLNAMQIATSYTSGSSETFLLEVVAATNALNAPVDPTSILVRWSSSNTKVATVAEDGVVTFVGSGTATIKCLAMDGSGKYTYCKVSVAQRVESITVTGQNSIAPGKYTTYKATVLPTNAKTKTVTWSVPDAPEGVTISTSGVVKVPSTVSSGTFTVVAAATDGSGQFGSKAVAITPLCTSIAITTTDIVTEARVVRSSTGVVSSAIIFPVDSGATAFNDTVLQLGYSITGNSTLPVWSSSSPTVASVDQSGLVTAHKVGSVTITCAAQDGSGRKAAMKVSVYTPVESVSVAGQLSISSGKTATFKATVLPSNASTKSVVWSVPGAPAGVTISTSGVVKVPSTVSSGSFTVVATAKDGSGVFGSKAVTITPLCTSITLTSGDGRVVRNSAYTILSASILTYDVDTTTVEDNVLVLGYSINGNNTIPVWSSSNPTIASVDQTGMVVSHKAGSATITCTTQDGSGKKAAMKVTVNVPTSYLTVGTKMPLMQYEEPTIAFGKSATNTVAYGDTYGTPTSKKVTWSFEVLEYDNESNITDVTAYMKANKRVALSSSGVLTVSSRMIYDWAVIPGGYLIVVTATATDGSGVSDSLIYYTQPATNTIVPRYKKITCDTDSMELVYFVGDSSFTDYTVTSSNPKVAGLISGVLYDDDAPNPNYPLYVPVYTGVAGTAVITIKANDGSGKYTTITVVVS